MRTVDAGAHASRTGYLGPLILAGAFVAFWLLFKGAPELAHIVFFAFFAVVLAALFDVPASLFSRVMPRPLAVLLTLVLLLLMVAGTLSLVVPLFMDQARNIARRAPQAWSNAEGWWQSHTHTGILGKISQQGPGGFENLPGKLAAMMKGAIPVAFGTVTAFAEAVVAVILGFYLVLQPEAYAQGLLRLFPKEKSAAVTEVLDGMGRVLKGWILGTVASMAIIGTVTAVGLLAVGVEGWFALGVLAFFGEFIPFAGPVLAAVPGLAVGLAESPHRALWVLAVYVGTHQLEGHIVQPLVMRKAVRIHPAVLILWQLALSLGFGFMGLLVATPLLAVIQTGVRIGYQKRVLGRNA